MNPGRGMVLRIDDVTEQRAAEARLDEAQRALLVSQVAGGVGHELNNLLARVICLAEDIQAEPDLRVIQEHAETLIVTAERAAEVVRRYMASTGTGVTDAEALDTKPIL